MKRKLTHTESTSSDNSSSSSKMVVELTNSEVEKTTSDIPSPSDLTDCCEETTNTANDTANIESSLDDAANKVTKNSLNDAANIDPDNSLDDYAKKDTDTTLNHSSNVDSIKS